MLVAQAAKLRYDHFTQVLAYWIQHAEPDGTEHTADKQRADRRFQLSKSFRGTWLGDLVLDPISGAVVDNQLRRIEDELFEADWAEARARLGDDVRAGDLARTPNQRRADALVEMARRAGASPAGGRHPSPCSPWRCADPLSAPTFAGRICQLADGTVVSRRAPRAVGGQVVGVCGRDRLHDDLVAGQQALPARRPASSSSTGSRPASSCRTAPAIGGGSAAPAPRASR